MIRHTAKLLARHNCVILPSVGAFLTHDVPAYYNSKEQVFMPPHRSLGFNPNVTVDDALLLSEYISDGKTSYEDANKALSHDIASLRRKLESDSICCFGELGTFHMNINGEISFVPGENAVEDPYNFGFEPLAVPLLSQCEEKKIVIKQHDFGRYIAIAAAVILAFFFVTPVSDTAFEKGMQASIAQLAPAEKSIPASAVKAEPVAVEESAACEIVPVENTATEKIITLQNSDIAKDIEQPAIEAVAETAVPQKRYSIIVASSPNADNAQLAIKELTRKHKADYTVVVGGGRHRISISDFNSAEEANEALSAVKNIFPDAWVHIH